MATEIERKFLVVDDVWRAGVVGTVFRQGYLSTVKERTVRVRVAGDRGLLTIKGITVGAVRTEFEYEIPVDDADHMLDELCEQPLIEKTRYEIDADGLTWESRRLRRCERRPRSRRGRTRRRDAGDRPAHVGR